MLDSRKIVLKLLHVSCFLFLATTISCTGKLSSTNKQSNTTTQQRSTPQSETAKPQVESGVLSPGEATGS
jgi:hypothetical protein